VIEPEATEPTSQDAAGDRHIDVRQQIEVGQQIEVRQHCGPYWLDFYAISDAVVCVVTDDELVSS
jgi:muramidase (phage lysozyme)